MNTFKSIKEWAERVYMLNTSTVNIALAVIILSTLILIDLFI